MPTIRFVKDYPEIVVESGANLMTTLLHAGLPVASSCHGEGVCGKCRVQILEHPENLSKLSTLEEILRARLGVLRPYRISCQTEVLGDVLVDTGYW
jgi:2Fe-2S ferredoxin